MLPVTDEIPSNPFTCVLPPRLMPDLVCMTAHEYNCKAILAMLGLLFQIGFHRTLCNIEETLSL